MKTKPLLAGSAVFVLMVGLGIRATRQVRDIEATMAALASERNQLREMAGRMEVRLQMAKAGLVELGEKSAPSAEVSANAKQGRRAGAPGDVLPATTASPTRRLSAESIVANDPQKMAVYTKNFRAATDSKYGGMFKALGLSPAQIESFKDAEVWLEEGKMDLNAAIESQGLTPDSAEYKKLWDNYDKSRAPKKAEVLGDLMEAYLEYYFTRDPRWAAQQLAWTGVFTGETVTSAQVEQAADILSANSKRRGSDPKTHGVEWATVDWPTASTQLKTVLSPGQIEILGGIVERDKLQRKVNELTMKLGAQFSKQSPAK